MSNVSLIDGHIDEMTDNEIIKALECCSTGYTYADCEKNGCPLYLGITMGCKYVDKENQLYSDALDLINRQQAELERLTKETMNMAITIESCQGEAIKEFAERLKDYLRKRPKWNCRREKYDNVGFSYDDVFFGIDKIVKEMVGEE